MVYPFARQCIVTKQVEVKPQLLLLDPGRMIVALLTYDSARGCVPLIHYPD
jgi:hypothetical protein